jgi:hypothetical protein
MSLLLINAIAAISVMNVFFIKKGYCPCSQLRNEWGFLKNLLVCALFSQKWVLPLLTALQ